MVEHKLEAGDQLVVLKLDRLGRDNIDVQQTIDMLLERGVKVVSLDLPARDLTSSEGKLIRQMFGAFAEFERNRIRERTLDGLEKAKANGVKLGRKEATDTTQKVQELRSEGLSQSKVAKRLGVSVSTVKRHWNKGEDDDLQANEVLRLAVTGLWVMDDLQLLYLFQRVMLCVMS